TRSLVDVHLPPRHALTIRLDAEPEEALCYETLSRLVAQAAVLATTQQRFALRRLLSDAGSTPGAAAAAIERYLASREAGEEGRNLQFANTLVNFDLPWNPMAIEQRIGRLHRIGQTRDVFIFNLVARGTLEERMLQILDEKINMFELVVGEIDAILGEMDEGNDFADLAFSAWAATTETGRAQAFDALRERLIA